MDRELTELYKMKKFYENLIEDYKNKCPHDKGVDIPNFLFGHRIGARLTKCKRCGETVGIYCECSPDHHCYYDTPDGKASNWHDRCIFCGLMYEE